MKRPTPLGRRRDRAPVRPVYADRRWHGVTLSARTKSLAAVVVLAVVGLGWYLGYLTENIATHRATTETQIRTLACLLVSETPPKVNDLADEIRAQYHCPPYKRIPHPLIPNPTVTVTRTASPHPGHARAQHTSSPQAAQRTPGVSPSSVHAGTRPSSSALRSATPSRAPTTTAPAPPSRTRTPSPSPSGVCALPLVDGVCHIIGA